MSGLENRPLDFAMEALLGRFVAFPEEKKRREAETNTVGFGVGLSSIELTDEECALVFSPDFPLTEEMVKVLPGQIFNELVKREHPIVMRVDAANWSTLKSLAKNLGKKAGQLRRRMWQHGSVKPLLLEAKSLGLCVQNFGELNLQQAEHLLGRLDKILRIATAFASAFQAELAQESRVAIRVFVKLKRDLRSFPPPLEYRPTIQPNAPALI